MSKLLKIKAALSALSLMFASEDPAPEPPADSVKISVEEVSISDRSIGGKVERVGSDGALSPLEDGNYVLSDGFAFALKDGLIISIVGVEAPAAEDPSLELAADPPAAEGPDLAAEVAAMRTEMDEMRKLIEELMSAINTMTGDVVEASKETALYKTQVVELHKALVLLADLPAEPPIEQPPVAMDKAKQDKISFIQALNATRATN